MTKTSKTIDAIYREIVGLPNRVANIEQVLARISKTLSEILGSAEYLVNNTPVKFSTNNGPATHAVNSKPKSRKQVVKLTPLNGSMAALRVNAELGYHYYAERSGTIHTISPWKVFIDEGMIKRVVGNKYTQTDLGNSPENRRYFMITKSKDGHYVTSISPKAGIEYLKEWAEKHPEYRRDKW